MLLFQQVMREVEHYDLNFTLYVDQNGAVDDLGLTAKRFTSPESLDAVNAIASFRRFTYSGCVLTHAVS